MPFSLLYPEDTINESGFVDDSIAAMKGSEPKPLWRNSERRAVLLGFEANRNRNSMAPKQGNYSGTRKLHESCCKGRTIHTYHTEGAGGGHAPDIIKACHGLLGVELCSVRVPGLWPAQCAAILHESHPAFHSEHRGGGRSLNFLPSIKQLDG